MSTEEKTQVISEEYLTKLLNMVLALQERNEYLEEVVNGRGYADMLIGTAELMDVVGTMFEDSDNEDFFPEVRMAFEKLDTIITTVLKGAFVTDEELESEGSGDTA